MKVVIPKDATVGMLFAQYISSRAPHPNAAKLALDYFLSDEGQVLVRHRLCCTRPVDVTLPADIAAKLLPQSAYTNMHFPTNLASFSAAIKKIVEGWKRHRRAGT